MKNGNKWNPKQYEKFKDERSQPFYDLLKLIIPKTDMTIIDLGCGTGYLTKELHTTLKAKKTLGIDSSKEMLEKSKNMSSTNLQFQMVNISEFISSESFDLIFSNAALQWLPNHKALFASLMKNLGDRGQFAVHMPANFDSPTHVIARELAKEKPYHNFLHNDFIQTVLLPEEYSKLFFELGFTKQSVRLQVYGHALESTESVIEWVKGSLLTYYEGLLPSDVFEKFTAEYRKRVLTKYGNIRPFFYPFKRLLLWAERSQD